MSQGRVSVRFGKYHPEALKNSSSERCFISNRKSWMFLFCRRIPCLWFSQPNCKWQLWVWGLLRTEQQVSHRFARPAQGHLHRWVICILKNEEPKHAISSSRLRQIFLLHYLKQTLSISNARSAPILVACTPPVNEMVINKRKGYAPLPVPDHLDQKMLLPTYQWTCFMHWPLCGELGVRARSFM